MMFFSSAKAERGAGLRAPPLRRGPGRRPRLVPASGVCGRDMPIALLAGLRPPGDLALPRSLGRGGFWLARERDDRGRPARARRLAAGGRRRARARRGGRDRPLGRLAAGAGLSGRRSAWSWWTTARATAPPALARAAAARAGPRGPADGADRRAPARRLDRQAVGDGAGRGARRAPARAELPAAHRRRHRATRPTTCAAWWRAPRPAAWC